MVAIRLNGIIADEISINQVGLKRVILSNLKLILYFEFDSVDEQGHNDPQMSLDYHLVDPLGDDEKHEQQSDVLDGC
jgi:hypothetical protein